MGNDTSYLKQLLLNNRSCRRFKKCSIDHQTLVELIDLSRFSASAANLQPLKYILIHQPDQNAKIFQCLGWAAYLKDWPGPKEEERPSAYIIMLGDTRTNRYIDFDAGIASQTILLGARSIGLAGCILASIKKNKLKEIIPIPEPLEFIVVIALGTPGEKIVVEEVKKDNNIQYWRDEDDVHHVPKRSLEDIIIDGFVKSPTSALDCIL